MSEATKTATEWLAEAQAATNEMDAHAAVIQAVTANLDLTVETVKRLVIVMQDVAKRQAALEVRVQSLEAAQGAK